MTQIDWSKAPEGATHYGEGNHCKFWAKDVRPGISYQFSNVYHDGPTGWMIRLGDPDYPITSIIPDWTGEGRPPVGTVCEVEHCGKWIKCEIIAHFQQESAQVAAFIFSPYSGNPKLKELAYYIADSFRPTRTPEQIAAAERAKECDKMFGIMCAVDREGNRSDMAEALYDAGYRKTMADAEEVKP